MRRLALWLYRSLIHARCRECSADELRRSALVFAPHPDDETLGCGGTILRKKAAGAKVQIVLLTDGSSAFPGLIAPDELTKLRYTELLDAAPALGVAKDDVFFLGFKDGRLSEHIAEGTDRIAELLTREQPAEIYVPYHRDPPPDHQATTQIALAAARRVLPQVIVYEYPVWFWYHWPIIPAEGGVRGKLHSVRNGGRTGRHSLREFRCCVSMAEQREGKRKALDQHRSQMTQLVADPNWKTLPSVANGDWLECFFQGREIFYRHGLDGST
jgi:LmbE family N-acetylglucosaminyl deacetylase